MRGIQITRREVLIGTSATALSTQSMATTSTSATITKQPGIYGEGVYGSSLYTTAQSEDTDDDDSDSSNFVQQIVERVFKIGVSDRDDEGVQLPIEPNTDATAGRVSLSETDSGVHVLHVDATSLPTNSTVTLGMFDHDGSLDTDVESPGAFTVTNQNALNAPIDLHIELENGEIGDSTIELVSEDGGVVTDNTGQNVRLDHGESVDVGIRIDTVEETGSEVTTEIILTAKADDD